MTASGVGIRHAGYLKVIILLNIYFFKKIIVDNDYFRPRHLS